MIRETHLERSWAKASDGQAAATFEMTALEALLPRRKLRAVVLQAVELQLGLAVARLWALEQRCTA